MARAPDSKSGRWWFESTGRCSAHDHLSPCSSVFICGFSDCVGWALASPGGCSPLALEAVAVRLRPDAFSSWLRGVTCSIAASQAVGEGSIPSGAILISGINRYRPPARVVFGDRIFDACSVTTGSTGFGWFSPVAQIGKSNRSKSCKLPVQVRSGNQWIGAQALGFESSRSSRLVSTRIPIWKCNGLGRRSVVWPVQLFVNLHHLVRCG